jgi:hypothetical protein
MHSLVRLTTQLFIGIISVGCTSDKSAAPEKDELHKAAEEFWDALSHPVWKGNVPDWTKAYGLLHPEASRKKSLETYNREWMQWVESKAAKSGWIQDVEVQKVTSTGDVATVETLLTFAPPPAMGPQAPQKRVTAKLRLKKDGNKWAVLGLE